MKKLTRTDLNVAITAFLDARSKSDGGFSPVGPKDIEQLDEIIGGLVALKYETDPDGDHPIRWQLCDWTRFEPSHFELIPRTTSRAIRVAGGDALKSYEDALDVAIGNLKSAADRVDVLQRCRREVQRRSTAVTPGKTS